MKVVPFLITYEIISILCDSPNILDSTPISNNAELTSTGSSPITAAHTTHNPFTVAKPLITFSPIVDGWNLTKILTKKGANLRNHSDDSVRISNPSNDDFQSLIRDSSFWVDKSLLVKELWQKLGNLSVVVIAPPKWGKSINLSMLKFYLDLPLDPNGFEIANRQSASYRYFREGKVVQSDGTIEDLDGLPLIADYEDHFANHPVIHISGKTLAMDDVLESFRSMIHETYKRHRNLLNRLTIEQRKTNSTVEKIAISDDIRDFRSCYELHKIRELDDNRLVRGVRDLIRLLFNTYRRKVVVLFDDYDHFVQAAYFNYTPNSARARQQEKMEFIWSHFLRCTFKETNTPLEKALVTGVLRALDDNTLRAYENFYNADVFGYDDLFPYYGILQPEYRQMIDKRGIDAGLAENATQWYGGYRTLGHSHVQMYAVYPVTKFLTTLQIRPDYDHHRSYLVDFVERMFRRPRFQRALEAFVDGFEQNGNHLTTMFLSSLGAMTRHRYQTIWDIERGELEYTANTEDGVFCVMTSIGYAAVYVYRPGYKMVTIRIPNRNMYRRYCAANRTIRQ